MEGNIAGEFRSLGIEIVADWEIFKENDAVFIRCAGAKLVLVFIIERENDPAEDLALIVLLGDLDGTACGLIQSRSGNNLPICGKKYLLGAAGGNIAVRGFCLLIVVVSEREPGENDHAGLIRSTFGDLVEGHVIDCELSALQRRVGLGIDFENLQSAGGFVVYNRLGDDLTVLGDLNRVLRIVGGIAGDSKALGIVIGAERQIVKDQDTVIVRIPKREPLLVAVIKIEAHALERRAVFIGLQKAQTAAASMVHHGLGHGLPAGRDGHRDQRCIQDEAGKGLGLLNIVVAQ